MADDSPGEMALRCPDCSAAYPPTTLFQCRGCGGVLEAAYQRPLDPARIESGETLFEKYGARLPSRGSAAGDEGGTPLVRAADLERALDVAATVYLKDERRNPTGSFKDRAFAPAVSLAAEAGRDAVLTASTGNAATACARYAARAGLDCYVLVEERVPDGKLVEPRVYGADVVRVPDLFTGGQTGQERLLRAVTDRLGAYLAFAYQPLNAVVGEGVKTISYEVAEQLAGVPDVVVTATGGGDNLAGQYRGYEELRAAGLRSATPRMVAAQAAAAAPLADAVAAGAASPSEIENPSSIASGINTPFAGQHGLDAIRDSGGTAVGVADERLVDGVTTLARTTGVWPEPASATVVPALVELRDRGELDADDVVVLTITGSGHKHTEPVEARFESVPVVDRDPDAIAGAFERATD